MSRYNKLPRSRSREREREIEREEHERRKFDEKKDEYDEMKRELEIDRRIEKMKEDERKREKEIDIERNNFLKRENELLRQIDRMKYRENFYNKQRPQINRFKRFNNFQNRNFQSYNNPNRPRFSNFNPNINNPRPLYNKIQRTNIYEPKRNAEIQNSSLNELNKLITNIEKEKIFEKDKCTNKIYLPRIQGINLVGLLIGPKGAFQKLLESNTGCKIYINGKFVKKKEKYFTFRDNDRPHVFIVGDSEEKVRKATRLVEEIIYADEATRNKIMQEQLKLSKQDTREENLNFEKKSGNTKDDDYLMTVSGPPGENARFYKIHNDYLGDVIGTNGETLKKIATESNCKIHLGKALIPNTQLRYVFIEGSEENYQIAKRMIEKIIGDCENMKN